MEKFYHITEVAKKLGVSAAAIRLYEKKGLISVKKDPRNGYRIFTEEDIYKIWSIFFHRSLSMKIDSINELKHAESLKAICEVVEAQKELTQQALAREKQLLAMWDMYDRYIARAKSADKAVKIVDSESLHFFEIDDFITVKTSAFWRQPLAVSVRKRTKGIIASFVSVISP
ncbi:MAG TPA: MerR family transcriptional regulator [Clostridiales bacterium]|nr:MerR family transcriptional regulator [Clostridiales bacterium]